jgi:hypothetical protein
MTTSSERMADRSFIDYNAFSAGQLTFAAATTLGIVTIGAAIGAATSVSMVSMVALGALAVLTAALSIASMTAYANCSTNDGQEYVEKFKKHVPMVLVGTIQFIAQALIQAVVQGAVDGIKTSISNNISGGEQHTINHRRI